MHSPFQDAEPADDYRELKRAIAAPLPALDDPQVHATTYTVQDPPFQKAGPGFWGVFCASTWVFAVGAALVLYFGLGNIWSAPPAVFMIALMLAVGPASLIVFASAAGREAQRVRAETSRLAVLAQDALVPVENAEAQARRLGLSVRSEIGALHTVVQSALDRFAELESAAKRNVMVFDSAVSGARDGAGVLAQTLERERTAFEQLSLEMRAQSEFLVDNVGRQIRMMREASRLVRTEYEAADQTMQAHLTAFASSAQLLAERTQDVAHAADSTQMATAKLDASLSSALDALTQASSLTDAARQSAESAALAANATASSVRETTQRAVADARKVAQLIRAETQVMQETAAETLEKLREAAVEARRASEEAQAAADRHSEALKRRINGMRPQPPVIHAVPANDEHVEPTRSIPALNAAGVPGDFRGLCRTEDFAPTVVANDFDPPSKDVFKRAGLDPAQLLNASDLDFIALRARQGGAARRDAVAAVAFDAVSELRSLFERDAQARAKAAELRAKPNFAGVKQDKGALVGYLLVDAALG